MRMAVRITGDQQRTSDARIFWSFLFVLSLTLRVCFFFLSFSLSLSLFPRARGGGHQRLTGPHDYCRVTNANAGPPFNSSMYVARWLCLIERQQGGIEVIPVTFTSESPSEHIDYANLNQLAGNSSSRVLSTCDSYPHKLCSGWHWNVMRTTCGSVLADEENVTAFAHRNVSHHARKTHPLTCLFVCAYVCPIRFLSRNSTESRHGFAV